MQIFKNARIIDGRSKNFIGYFSVKEGRFFEVKEGEYNQNGPNIVDLNGKTVVPGFIDCHVHFYNDGDPFSGLARHEEPIPITMLKAVKNAEKTVRAGVTTVRDCGSRGGVDFSLKKAAQQGLCIAPRMYVCGCMICITGGHGWQSGIEADGPDEVRKVVRGLLKQGADHIKLVASGGILSPGTEIGASQLTEEEMRAAVEVAHFAGKTVCAHAHGTEAIKKAVRAGVDSIEHGYLIDEEGIDLMVQNKTFLVATSAAVRNVVNNAKVEGVSKDMVRKAQEAIERHIIGFMKAHKAGVRMAMGTDSGVPFSPHGNNLKEIIYLVEMGMTPHEALQAATHAGAELLNIDKDLGSIEKNKYADFLILNKNPLDNIYSLIEEGTIEHIYIEGKEVK